MTHMTGPQQAVTLAAIGVAVFAATLTAQALARRLTAHRAHRRREAFYRHADQALAVVEGTPLTAAEWAILDDLEARYRTEPFNGSLPKEGAE